MEKAARAGMGAGIRWEVAIGCLAALAAAMPCAAAGPDPAPQPGMVAQATAVDPPLRLKVQTTALPRFDAQDSGFQAPRVDLSLTPLNRDGAGLGAVFGLSNPGRGLQPGSLQPHPAVDLGLRWTQRLQSQAQIDITAWRRMNAPEDAYTLVEMNNPVYGARVEMKFSGGPKTGFLIDHGAVGFQMESGARIAFKRKDGRPMVYYRSSF